MKMQARPSYGFLAVRKILSQKKMVTVLVKVAFNADIRKLG